MLIKDTIPGIYNYCDRWCERCTFTERCAIFEDENQKAQRITRVQPEIFLESLPDRFRSTIALLRQSATSYGLDMNNISTRKWKEFEEQELDVKLKWKSHPVSRTSFLYAASVKMWFAEIDIEKYASDLEASLKLEIKTMKQGEEEVDTFRNCVRVILWYANFIHTKLDRALGSSLRMDRWAEENGLQKDSDGSAKIALIAIDRSIRAWNTLYDLFPDQQDNILTYMATLQQIKKLSLQQFPRAMEFVRPGFDEAVNSKKGD
jgi:hypothetical protein